MAMVEGGGPSSVEVSAVQTNETNISYIDEGSYHIVMEGPDGMQLQVHEPGPENQLVCYYAATDGPTGYAPDEEAGYGTNYAHYEGGEGDSSVGAGAGIIALPGPSSGVTLPTDHLIVTGQGEKYDKFPKVSVSQSYSNFRIYFSQMN
jgi:hypothetical protein